MTRPDYKKIAILPAAAFLISLLSLAVYILFPGILRTLVWALLFYAVLADWRSTRDRHLHHSASLLLIFAAYFLATLWKLPAELPETRETVTSLIGMDGSLFYRHYSEIGLTLYALVPGQGDLFNVFAMLLVLLLIAPIIARFVIRSVSNDYFEFFGHLFGLMQKRVLSPVMPLFGSFIATLALSGLAFYLLHLGDYVVYAATLSLWTLVPGYGLLLGLAVVLVSLPLSSFIYYQMTGIVILGALVWFVRYLFFYDHFTQVRSNVPLFQLFLLHITVGALFGFWAASFLFVPFYISLLFVDHLIDSTTLIHSNSTKILAA